MMRLFSTVVAATVLTLTLAIPAQLGHPAPFIGCATSRMLVA